MANTTMEIIGSNNNVYIAENCVIENSEFCLEDEGCAIHIGPGTTVGNAHFAANENGSKIEIGADCMLARGIDVRTGDSHGIYDISGQRLNAAQSISIGNHVWVGMHVTILKGARIGDGCIVATRALVSQGVYDSNSIIAGVPAKVTRSGVRWTRKRYSELPPHSGDHS